MSADPLSFLDEYTETEDAVQEDSDPLSFLGRSSKPKPSLRKNRKVDYSASNDSSDPLSFLDEQEEPEQGLFTPKPFSSEKTSPEKSLRQNILATYAPEEKTPEELKAMSIEERMEYIQDLKNLRELQSGSGFAKGALSGATFGASEHIPGLKPDEQDLMVGLGETVGSYLPISKLYSVIGKPLVNLAMKSPVAKQGLMALARMTGFGLTGATYEGAKEAVKTGEIPSADELAKEGAKWAAIDGILQSLGFGIAFQQSVARIAEAEGVSSKEVLSKLWNATKNYAKLKFGRPVKGEVLPEDIELLLERANAAETEGLSKATEIEVIPEEVAEKELVKPEAELEKAQGKKAIEEVVEQENQAKEVLSIPENAVLTKPESISTGERGGESVATVSVRKTGEEGQEYFEHEELPITEEEQQLIDASNAWGRAGDNKEASKLAQDAREMIYNRLKGQKTKVRESVKEPEEITWQYTREDFPTKEEAQEYLDHLQTSLKKAPESHKPILERDIRNLEELVSGFEMEGAAKKPIPEELPKKTTQVPPRQTRPRQPVVGKKQAVARSKILNLFRDAFTDPIRLGKISQRNAAGIHKLWPKVTRLLKDNDVETAAHEIGHNLHTTLYGGDAKTPKEQAKNIENALKPYLDELKPLAHYEPWGMEGFAEFTRLYVTNPDVALGLAPKFYAKFEADLGAQYPEMKNALLEARDYYDQYLQGTPQSRIRAQTSYGEDKGKLANIVDSVKKYLNPDYLKTQFLDDVFPAKRLVAEAFGIPVTEVENLKDERNLYRSLRVLKGAVGKGDVFVLHETFNAKTLDKINGSLRDILKKLPDDNAYREFNDYLIARRVIEKSGQQVETGINLGDAVAVEADLRSKYAGLAQELDKYNDTLLKYAKDSGLLSDEQYKMIKQNNVLYAPFQRVMEAEKGGAASGAGRLQAGKPIKRMKGSTRDIIAPVESIIKNTYSVILNAEKNLAGQVLAKIAKMKNMGAYVEHVPTPIKLKSKISKEEAIEQIERHLKKTQGIFTEGGGGIGSEEIQGLALTLEELFPDAFLRFGAGQYPAGENIVTVYFDGKPMYYEVTPEIFDMWTKGIGPYTADLITKILRIPARTLRAGAILNPRFAMKNAIRDTWGSWLFTKYGKTIKDPAGLFIDTLYSPLAMLATATKKGALYVEWMKSGGGMSTMQSLDRESVTKKLEEVRGKWQGVRPIQWLRKVSEISEETNRLSEFGKALAVEGKTRLGREIAAFAARDLSVDFAKIGIQTKMLNQIIPFWNATVQGGDKLIRTMANPKDRKDFLPRILGFIVLPSLMLAWLNKDDPRVQEFYEEEKDFNFITFIGDTALKIPVPFETGVIAHGLTQRMFNYFMKKDPEAFEKFMGSVVSAMLPGFIPTAGLPFFEAWANKSFFTGARIIPRGQEDLVAKYQYKNNTSSTARLLGRAMAYMLGQETRSKAASPAIIDHFINAWGGGLGRSMLNISDASLEAAGLSDKIPDPRQTITEKMGLDAFVARYPRASTRSIEKFYDNYADATSRQKSFKYAEKMDLESPEEQEGAYQRFEKIYDYKALKKAYKAVQSCQKEINNIWNDPSIDSELKKQMINDLYLQMIEFAKAANEDIRQYRLGQE